MSESRRSAAEEIKAHQGESPRLSRAHQQLDGHDSADQAVLVNRCSTGLSPSNPSLMRSWL